VLAAFLVLATPALCGTISLGTFYQFSFEQAGTPATGCAPDDPAGAFCLGSFGTPTLFLDAPPWTFVAPAIGASLTVTDAFTSGDRFEVFDFGGSLGLTSAPLPLGDCEDDPVVCLADPSISHGSFLLAPGAHSLTITPTAAPNGTGTGYLQVEAVPEPATWLFLCSGLLLFAWARRRRSLLPSQHPSKLPKRIRLQWVVVPAAALAIGAVFWFSGTTATAQGPVLVFTGPTSSQPLALTADNAFLASVNPDNNSVSFFDLRLDRNRRLSEVPVQTEPNGVALLPDGSKAYVANTVSGTVSVIRLNIRNGIISQPYKHIPVGTEPYGLVLTPHGRKLYVSNARSNTVSVIDTLLDVVTATVPAGIEPRGLAVTNDGDDDDNDETLYVTQFLSLPIAGKVDGQDDSKAGKVTIISTGSDAVTGTATVNPIADTGFKATGDAILRIPPGDPANPANFTFLTGAYPNQLNNIAIKNGFAYLPNTGASPNGPVRFDVNTQSLLAVIDRSTSADAGKTINMHLAVAQQPAAIPRRFITVPWAMAFKHTTNEGYVVSAASNIVVKVAVDAVTGLPAVQKQAGDPTRVLQIPVGKNPRGIVINSTDTRAYVMNYVSRDISVINLGGPEQVLTSIGSAALPVAGTQADKIQVGKELYNTSVGVFDPAPGTTTAIAGRMSAAGWGACSACHPFGHSDNVVWIFPSGPKRTIPQHTDFDQTDPTRSIMRMLNWSAERDEEEDFERNIRAVSGGAGLIVLADGVTPEALANVPDLLPVSNANRIQLKVRGVNAWDAIKAYEQFGIRAPISPTSKTEPDVIAGRAIFISANCQQCHGGPQWTSSRVRFTPPPSAAQVVNGQVISELRQVGTFDPAGLNEVRQNAAAPLGADGFAPASLLSVFAFPQTFLHNGVVTSLGGVLDNVTHRSAGTGGVDTLSNAADRAKVVRFIESIDAATVPIP
jgi:YVTN family beta-propeller protein